VAVGISFVGSLTSAFGETKVPEDRGSIGGELAFGESGGRGGGGGKGEGSESDLFAAVGSVGVGFGVASDDGLLLAEAADAPGDEGDAMGCEGGAVPRGGDGVWENVAGGDGGEDLVGTGATR